MMGWLGTVVPSKSQFESQCEKSVLGKNTEEKYHPQEKFWGERCQEVRGVGFFISLVLLH